MTRLSTTAGGTPPLATASRRARRRQRRRCPACARQAVGTPTDPARNGDATNDGDAAYQGSADLVEVRLGADASSYYVVFVLQTMLQPDATVVGLGFSGTSEGGGVGTGLAAYRHVLQVAPTGATLDGAAVVSRIDPAANTIEARIPRGALPAGAWNVAAAAGRWTGTAWGAVTDLAPVPAEPTVGTPNCWFELAQARAIAAGSYPSTAVDSSLLGGGYSAAASIPRGPQVRMYYPHIHIGEGVVGQPRYGQNAAAKIYRGLLQPYAAYLPESYDPARANPLVMLLHCLNCTDDVYYSSSWPGLARLADSRGAPIVTPLAYGEGGHYEGDAECDVFEVLADMSARFRLDRDRFYLSGMSMGSLGTFRLGLLYPDMWARTFAVGNYTTPFCVTPLPSAPTCVLPFNYYDLLGNARNLDYALVNGTNDELTPITQSIDVTRRLDALGYPSASGSSPAASTTRRSRDRQLT